MSDPAIELQREEKATNNVESHVAPRAVGGLKRKPDLEDVEVRDVDVSPAVVATKRARMQVEEVSEDPGSSSASRGRSATDDEIERLKGELARNNVSLRTLKVIREFDERKITRLREEAQELRESLRQMREECAQAMQERDWVVRERDEFRDEVRRDMEDVRVVLASARDNADRWRNRAVLAKRHQYCESFRPSLRSPG